MHAKDVIRHLKAAAWQGPDEIEAFVREVGVLAPADAPKLLATLIDQKLTPDDVAHRSRCAAFAAIIERSLSPKLAGELFVPAVRALRTADPHARAMLVQIIPCFNNVAVHGELCQLLGVSDPQVRRAAAEVLRQVGGKTALEVIEQLVGQPQFPGRIEALDVMVPKAQYHSIPMLAATLSLGSPEEQVHALRYLADTKLMAKDPERALLIATTALEDPNTSVVAQAIVTVASLAQENLFFTILGGRLDSQHPAIVRGVVEAMGRFRSPRVIAVLARKFAAGPNAVRVAVLDSLEAIGSADVLPLLFEALGHRHLMIRTRAASIVAKLSVEGRIDGARAILWLLRSRDVNVRRIAVEIATKVSDPKGELSPRLLRFLRDEDWWVRESVMDALVEMSGAALTRCLVEYLSDPSDVIRRFAVGALQRIKDPKTLGALVRVAQSDPDWWAREQAIEAIASLGDLRAAPYLLDLIAREPELRLACVQAVKQLRVPDVGGEIGELVTDDDPDVRVAAMECLAELNNRSQVLWVKSAENDPVTRVRSAARELLSRWRLSALPNAPHGDEPARAMVATLDALLLAGSAMEADDLLLQAGRPPYVKHHGKVTPIADEPITDEQVRSLLVPHLSHAQLEDLEQKRDLDFSYEVRSHHLRFRANVFHQFTGLSAVFRTIRNVIPKIDELSLPPIVATFGNLKNGLVLVGGPTGAGKSTTLAALIDYINRTSSRHIITIEDPIEVVHERKGCLVTQREVGTHMGSFNSALRDALREDPDVILVGEMRDLDTIRFAITASETGHLVFGTVHTVSVDTTVDRLINAFPSEEQPQVRAILSETLRAVICQHLLRRKDAPGRICAVEVLIMNDAISSMVRKGKTFQIPSVLLSSRDQGMQSMDQELIRLVKEGKVHLDEAFMKANDKKAFEGALGAGERSPSSRARSAP
jgi:twitching motility protein PilT